MPRPGVKPHASLRYVVAIKVTLTHVLAACRGSILVWTLIRAVTCMFLTCVTAF